ncbi:MAG TPA: hypothetical protein VK163_01230 [Opitutaceae bacterium]|nr:hypothetical protein [Opitutaceae bacterium]
MTYTATQAPVSTSAFSWGDFANNLLTGATTVAAAKYLANAPTGQQVSAAAATPAQPTASTPAAASASIPPGLLYAGGAVVLGLVLILALRK